MSHIAGDEERLDRFLAVTGLDPSRLREEANRPGFAAGVLDYVCSDESLLIGFAAEQGVSPEVVAGAWRMLAGPAGGDW